MLKLKICFYERRRGTYEKCLYWGAVLLCYATEYTFLKF